MAPDKGSSRRACSVPAQTQDRVHYDFAATQQRHMANIWREQHDNSVSSIMLPSVGIVPKLCCLVLSQ